MMSQPTRAMTLIARRCEVASRYRGGASNSFALR